MIEGGEPDRRDDTLEIIDFHLVDVVRVLRESVQSGDDVTAQAMSAELSRVGEALQAMYAPSPAKTSG